MSNSCRDAEHGPDDRDCQEHDPADRVSEGCARYRRRQHGGGIQIGGSSYNPRRQLANSSEQTGGMGRVVSREWLMFFAEQAKRIQMSPQDMKSLPSNQSAPFI